MFFSFSFFLLLSLSPSFSSPPVSPIIFNVIDFTVMDASGVWFARAVGLWMVSVTLSPWTVGVNKVKLAKVYLPINLGLMGLFAQAAFSLDTTGPGKNAVLPINMWYTQLPIAAAFLGMNFLALSESDDDKKGK